MATTTQKFPCLVDTVLLSGLFFIHLCEPFHLWEEVLVTKSSLLLIFFIVQSTLFHFFENYRSENLINSGNRYLKVSPIILPFFQPFTLRPGIHRISLRQQENGFLLSKLALVPLKLLMWTDLGMQSHHISDGFLSAFPDVSNPDPRFGRLHSQGLNFLLNCTFQTNYCMHVQCHTHLDLPHMYIMHGRERERLLM